MDKGTLFRKLMKNRFIEDIDYKNALFTFQTVFHKSAICYCCCPCAFEHEFFDYVSDKGEIDEDYLEQIVDRINKGQCPHVCEVSVEYITETGVNGIHIAAVVGPETVVWKHLDSKYYLDSLGTVFHLSPYETAMIKNNAKTFGLYLNDLPNHLRHKSYFRTFLSCERAIADKKYISLEFTSILQMCVKHENMILLKTVLLPNLLYNGADIAEALAVAFKNKLVDFQELLIKYMSSLASQGCKFKYFLKDSSMVAIFYDRPAVLDQILSFCLSEDTLVKAAGSLAEVCFMLRRTHCQEILSKYKIYAKKAIDNHDNFTLKTLLNLLLKFSGEFKHEIVGLLKTIPNVHEAVNCKEVIGSGTLLFHNLPLIHQYLTNRNIDAVKTMIDIGANIDSICSERNTPLTHILSHPYYDSMYDFRRLLELLIFWNPNTKQLNKSAVKLGVKIDTRVDEYSSNIDGNYQTDGKPHFIYGHDSNACAMNFVAPLLIECGFHAPRRLLIEARNKDLHPAVLEYIVQCLDEVRPLKLQCRDRLRSHYKGRGIHCFMATAEIPSTIKDYILLKNVLKLM